MTWEKYIKGVKVFSCDRALSTPEEWPYVVWNSACTVCARPECTERWAPASSFVFARTEGETRYSKEHTVQSKKKPKKTRTCSVFVTLAVLLFAI